MTTPPTPQPLHPLLLLAEWIEAEAACDGTHETSVLAVLARSRVVTLDPAALRAQAEADAGEAELLAELREALVAFDAASAEEDAAMVALMGASQNAPKNERGQFLDPDAVHRAAEPFRPRHQAAQDARMEARDIIDGLALESARLAVKLAGGLPALAQADAGGDAQ